MIDEGKQTALIEWIGNQLHEGISLTDDVLGYLYATFGTYDLPAVLKQAESCEIDSLLELLFYPGHEIQVRFEAAWAGTAFTHRDQQAVIRRLSAQPPTAEIVLPVPGQTISVPVPAYAVESFVQRLNICWRPEKQLARALKTHCSGQAGFDARVQLRNARLSWHADQVSFICLFLARVPVQEAAFGGDLAFLLSILPELVPGKEYYDFLISKKFFYFQSLCRAEAYERKRRVSAMEVMMMQGARSAHGSIDEWRRSMRQVDRICRALFGRTQFFQEPDDRRINLDNGDQLENMRDIIDILS